MLISQATRMLVWGETPKHVGELVSMRKRRHKEHLENEKASLIKSVSREGSQLNHWTLQEWES